MINKMILHELKSILAQRREVTKEQRAYARVEEELMSEMYPITRPSEEKRPPNCRTLERYIGYQAMETMRKYNEISYPVMKSSDPAFDEDRRSSEKLQQRFNYNVRFTAPGTCL